MESWMWVVWLSVFVLALVIEAIGTDLVSIWFAAGALVALILSLIPDVAWWIELVVFLVISIATLLCFRPMVQRFTRGRIVSSNVDELKGQKGRLLARIDPLHRGAVMLGDLRWTAIAGDEKASIPAGAMIEILAVSGNKLVVKEVAEPTQKENKQ
ncbi:MAG: NfeD family protein [Bacilli bacterium]|nr:NfeD family protein [Bacilli bacterium]